MKYCAFLRGVNVKGTAMKMADVVEVFKKQGERINVFDVNNFFDKEIDSKSVLQFNQPQLNKKWSYEHFSSNNFYDHLIYEGKSK